MNEELIKSDRLRQSFANIRTDIKLRAVERLPEISPLPSQKKKESKKVSQEEVEKKTPPPAKVDKWFSHQKTQDMLASGLGVTVSGRTGYSEVSRTVARVQMDTRSALYREFKDKELLDQLFKTQVEPYYFNLRQELLKGLFQQDTLIRNRSLNGAYAVGESSITDRAPSERFRLPSASWQHSLRDSKVEKGSSALHRSLSEGPLSARDQSFHPSLPTTDELERRAAREDRTWLSKRVLLVAAADANDRVVNHEFYKQLAVLRSKQAELIQKLQRAWLTSIVHISRLQLMGEVHHKARLHRIHTLILYKTRSRVCTLIRSLCILPNNSNNPNPDNSNNRNHNASRALILYKARGRMCNSIR